jgi:transcriptional regulator NrdR family protein
LVIILIGGVMMKVIKKDGRMQDFDIEKIKLTLERVSDDVHEPLTESDIKKLAKIINDVIVNKNKEHVHSFEIRQIVIDQLRDAGFAHIAQAYDDYQKKWQ